MLFPQFIHVATEKPALEVADVFRQHFEDYLEKYACTPQEMKAVNAIMRCRTAVLGGYIRQCDSCGKFQIAYKACKNRHCPKCGGFEKAQWLAKQSAKVLPVPHFQVVFTVAHEVNELAYHNPEVIYNLVMRTAGRLLREFGRKYLGGDVGCSMVLHTWGQTLQHHIHVHCMVPAGALVRCPQNGFVWQEADWTFLFPVVELSARFRQAICEGVRKLEREGKLRLVGECAELELAATLQKIAAKKWEVYIEKPPQDATLEQLIGYFARYMYRTAISNRRLLKLENGQVTFEYFDNRQRDEQTGKGKLKTTTLGVVKFISRFLRHVLPKGFVRVRHYGLYASGMKLKWLAAQILLQPDKRPPETPQLELADWLQETLGQDPFACPFCGEGRLQERRPFARLGWWQMIILALMGLPVFGREATS